MTTENEKNMPSAMDESAADESAADAAAWDESAADAVNERRATREPYEDYMARWREAEERSERELIENVRRLGARAFDFEPYGGLYRENDDEISSAVIGLKEAHDILKGSPTEPGEKAREQVREGYRALLNTGFKLAEQQKRIEHLEMLVRYGSKRAIAEERDAIAARSEYGGRDNVAARSAVERGYGGGIFKEGGVLAYNEEKTDHGDEYPDWRRPDLNGRVGRNGGR